MNKTTKRPLNVKIPQIKICGITSVQDAYLCANAGANALGFIFAPISKRLVTVAQAKEASLVLGPTVGRVGVFMNQSTDEVLRLAEASRMSAIQLHGKLSEGMLEQIAEFYPIIRVLSPAQIKTTSEMPAQVTLMIDAPQPGSGQALDWANIRQNFPAKAWLAGGLRPDNVAEAIRTLTPIGVDAVSHLETKPGIKDPQAVLAFVEVIKHI